MVRVDVAFDLDAFLLQLVLDGVFFGLDVLLQTNAFLTPASGTLPGAAPMRWRAAPPGQLGREGPLALEVTHVLDEVPPHLVPDQLVAEARRAAGVPVALYVVDIARPRSSCDSQDPKTSPTS